jgi:hypothetical protein
MVRNVIHQLHDRFQDCKRVRQVRATEMWVSQADWFWKREYEMKETE